MSNRARVLFVDDEKRVLNAMRGMFRRKFDLFLTTEGAAAVKIASENPIDVIVADQRMPGMTGIEVLGKVKELSPNTIRILLTGYAAPSAVEGSINVGEVFRFQGKPCPPKVLRETLDLAITATRTARGTASPGPPALADEQLEKHSLRPATGQTAAPTGVVPVLRQFVHPVQAEHYRNRQSKPPAIDGAASPLIREHRNDESSSHWHSVTDVVMAADSYIETRDIDIRTTAKAQEVGVVVYTVDAQFAETTIRALSTERSTTLATSLIKVMQTIEQDLAGVLITDYTNNSARLQRIIGALKQYLPELVTIVVSDSRDTTDMINLINYGQVFRYILKPVSPQQLRYDIDAATAKHLDLCRNPESIKRHAVAEFSNQTETSTTLNQLIGRARQLRLQRVGAEDGY